MKLPPDVSAANFAAALRKFETIVGKQWVFSSDEDLGTYRDAYSPLWGEPEERVAAAAVAPENVDQVQAVVRAANEFRIPLYPISTGRNLGYGGAAPGYSGSVVLDLKRMNRILEINEKLAYVLVEPGVSFFDLYREIQKRGVKLWPSVPAPGWGSPIGNALEHGAGTRRDHFATHCGMEVVLPDGELLRTGMGAVPNSPLWQTYQYGFGPFIDGLFSQSNFGIVTKMGFNLNPEPEAVRTLSVSAWDYDDIVPFVDAAAYLVSTEVSKYPAGLVSPLMSSPAPDVMALMNRTGGAAASDWNQLGRDKKQALFSTNMRFCGSARIVDAQLETAREKFASIRGATFEEGPTYRFPTDHSQIPEAVKTMFGIPGLAAFGALSMQGRIGHFFFSPSLPMSGEQVLKANRVFHEAARKLDYYWGWANMTDFFPKNYTVLKDFDVGHDPAVNRKNRDIFHQLLKVAAENGWSEYRAPAAFQDNVMDVFSFNNHALRRFNEKIKDAIDPRGILAAGRGGIWPKHLRGKQA